MDLRLDSSSRFASVEKLRVARVSLFPSVDRASTRTSEYQKGRECLFTQSNDVSFSFSKMISIYEVPPVG